MGKPFNFSDRDIRRDLVAPRIREMQKCKMCFMRQESTEMSAARKCACSTDIMNDI